MNAHRWYAALLVVVTVCVDPGERHWAVRAQEVAADGWVNVPGLGPLRLGDLPSDLQEKVRRPGMDYPPPLESYGDLLPLDGTAAQGESEPVKPDEPLTVSEPLPPANDEERKARQAAIERMYPKAASSFAGSAGGAVADHSTPDDAYLRALEQIEQLEKPQQPSQGATEPQSLRSKAIRWLAKVKSLMTAREAVAQPASCVGASQWTSIGPAPHTLYNVIVQPPGFVKNSGIVKAIAVDSSSYDPVEKVSRTLFLGGRSSGLWKTQDGGASWTTSTDSLASPNKTSLQIEAIKVRPGVILAGTGIGAQEADGGAGTGLPLGIGLLRSTDGGTTWNQIGPTISGTIYDSTLAIKEIAIDTVPSDSVVWVATSRGLWYSANADNPSVLPNQVTWARITSLPNDGSGNPEGVNHVVISASSNQVIYASIGTSPSGNSGWRKSTNGGSTWSLTNTGLPSNPQIRRAAVGPGDTIYTIVDDDAAPECGGNRARLYRTTNGGASWTKLSPTGICGGEPCPIDQGPICDCCQTVGVNPTNSNEVIAGGVKLFRSTDGWSTATVIGDGVVHIDQHAVTFDPSNSDIFYVGTDGGIWKRDTPANTWTFLHGTLANLEFYHGSLDTLNYGNSGGGTQDNNNLKGGLGSVWTRADSFGDGKRVLFDPKDSNTMYFTGSAGSDAKKSVDGGGKIRSKNSGLATPVDVHSDNFAFDPTDSKVLLTWSGTDRKVYRSTTAAEPPAGGGNAWTAISQGFPAATGETRTVVAAPVAGSPSNLIFAGTSSRGVWRTTPGTFGTWTRVGGTQIPDGRAVKSLTFQDGQACTATSCIMYATTGDPTTGGVYLSVNAGNTWYNIGSALPNVPMNTLVIDHNDANVIFVGTDVGLFRGTHTGGTPGTWTWCAYNNGLPKTALVKGLAVHRDTGMFRAFTYGRSAFEAFVFGIPNVDVKVNTTNPVTEVQPPRIGSNLYGAQPGSLFGVAWRDDRAGANNWRAYYKAYDNGTIILPINPTEIRVDLGAPLVESLGFSAHPTQTSTPYCARFAWHDRRQNGVNPDVFAQYRCSDGYALWGGDLPVDTAAPPMNSTNPAIVFQPNLDFAVAWESGTATRQIYARFFSLFGAPKSVPSYGTQGFPVSTSALDATAPAIAANGASEVVIAWQEKVSANEDYIYARKYTQGGAPLTGVVRLDDAVVSNAGQVSVAIDGSNNVTVAWSEAAAGQARKVVAARCGSNLTGCVRLDGGCKRCNQGADAAAGCVSNADCPGGACVTTGTVSCGPRLAPVGGEIAQVPAAASDGSGNILITWEGNPSDGSASPLLSPMAKSFNSGLTVARNEFRVDRAGRVDARSPVTARGAQAGEFLYAWRDKRAGHHDVYVRKLQSVQ